MPKAEKREVILDERLWSLLEICASKSGIGDVNLWITELVARGFASEFGVTLNEHFTYKMINHV